jgi:hypothetical protein
VDERSDPREGGALPAPDRLVRGDGVPSFAARLDAWLGDARVDGSADARSRERWLHAAAEADATFAGVLLDLAERRAGVAVTTTATRRHHGCVEALGADFAALRTAAGAEVLLSLRAISSVRTAPLVEPALGARPVTTELRLADVLAELAAERTRVLLVMTGGGDVVSGQLRAVGDDVITVRTATDPAATAYVPAPNVAEVGLG